MKQARAREQLPGVHHPDSGITERVARVFISSTFEDLSAEREIIAMRVIPELQVRARAIDLEVLGIDLRWGIPPAEARRGGTVRSCLREVARCNYFVGIIGDRSGWIPDPAQFTDAVVAEFPVLRDAAPGLSMTHLEFLFWMASHAELDERTICLRRTPDRQRVTKEVPPHRLLDDLRARRMAITPFRVSTDLYGILVDRLWDSMRVAFPRKPMQSAFEERSSRHAAYAKRLSHDFMGREAVITKIASAVRSMPVVTIVGPPGSGRTATLAKAMDTYRLSNPSHEVLTRFPEREGGQRSLSMFAGDIFEALTGEPAGSDDFLTDDQAARELVGAAFRAVTDRRVGPGTFVAALDLNLRTAAPQNLAWIPSPLPDWFRLVLTADAADVTTEPGLGSVALPALDRTESKALVNGALARHGRRMSDRQLMRAAEHPEAGKPLFLRTLIHEVSKARSFRAMPPRLHRCLRARTTHDLLCTTLIASERRFGKGAIHRTLTATLASQVGMSEPELCAFAGLPMARWATIRNQLHEWLYLEDGLVQVRSLQFCGAIGARYFVTPESFVELCREMCEWYLMRPPERRIARILHGLLQCTFDPMLQLRVLANRAHGPWIIESIPTHQLAKSWAAAVLPLVHANASRFAAEVLDGALAAWRDPQADDFPGQQSAVIRIAEAYARLRARLLAIGASEEPGAQT